MCETHALLVLLFGRLWPAWSLPSLSEIRRRWAARHSGIRDRRIFSGYKAWCSCERVSDLLQGAAVSARTFSTKGGLAMHDGITRSHANKWCSLGIKAGACHQSQVGEAGDPILQMSPELLKPCLVCLVCDVLYCTFKSFNLKPRLLYTSSLLLQ